MTAESPLPASNVIEVTVGELSGALKRTIEDRFGYVRVRGEIANYRGPHSSGHAYFCLKDDIARIDAVVWKSAFLRLKTKPQEGLEVIATGRVTTFPGKSTYQIVIETIEPAGIGALMAMLDARRKALAAEGLFADDRKQPIPFLPKVIGVVTSPTGAVIRDILHRLHDRFPRRVVLWPVRVQGETAAEEIAAAIAGFNAVDANGPVPRPDVLIVARGGGSLEDLWAFNEEAVVRAAAASAIPLISGVGHETDVTLIDHAADLRAPTPSGAAEKAVPVRSELLMQHADRSRRLAAALIRNVERQHGDLRALVRALPAPETITALRRQWLDRADDRLAAARVAARDRRHLELARLSHRLSRQAPLHRLAARRHQLAAFEQRMVHCLDRLSERRTQGVSQLAQRLRNAGQGLMRDIGRAADRRRQASEALPAAWERHRRRLTDRIELQNKLLNSLGYRQVLSRGFALIRDASERPVRSSEDAARHAVLDIEFADGHIAVQPGERRPAPRRSRMRDKAEQGTLF